MIHNPETDAQRAARQRREAAALVNAGRLDRESFAWYEKTYWSKHAPIVKTASEARA